MLLYTPNARCYNTPVRSTSPGGVVVISWLKTCWHGLRRVVFTRENAWALLLAFLMILGMIMLTARTQPRFIYGNF
jgi:hypothetical protein